MLSERQKNVRLEVLKCCIWGFKTVRTVRLHVLLLICRSLLCKCTKKRSRIQDDLGDRIFRLVI